MLPSFEKTKELPPEMRAVSAMHGFRNQERMYWMWCYWIIGAVVCVCFIVGYSFGITETTTRTQRFVVHDQLLSQEKAAIKPADTEGLNLVQPFHDKEVDPETPLNATEVNEDPRPETLPHKYVLPRPKIKEWPHDLATVVGLLEYWRPDGSPFNIALQEEQKTSKHDKYLTFESDHGGFNNIRMGFEFIVGATVGSGRTLVLPPLEVPSLA